jgi:hypothetical protein
LSDKPDIIPNGLPDHLPDGERLLWQGRPDWKRLAVNAFHVRKVAVYFATVIGMQAIYRIVNGASLTIVFENVPLLLACAVASIGILMLIAYASARTTLYTLTSKRALMRVGIALPIHVNIPFAKVDAVSFANTGKGAGSLCFKPGDNVRLAYAMLWPHAKPWNFSKPQPTFREIADVETVAGKLAMVMGGAMPTSQHADVPAAHLAPAE